MNAKKFLLATVSGLVVMFLLSWLGHEVIISGMLETDPMEPIARETPLVLGIVVAYLVIALLMAYIYPRGIEGESVFGNGIRFGVLMGLFLSLPISLILFSTLEDVSFGRVIAESVWHMIEQGTGGVVIAYIYGIDGEGEAESTADEPGPSEESSPYDY